MDRREYAREIRYALTDIRGLCEQLGFIAGKGSYLRQSGGGYLIRCPFHDERTPSCSVRLGPDSTIAVKCHGCGQGGDALSLVAASRGLGLRRDFKQVLIESAELAGLHDIARELESGVPQARVATPPRPAAPAEPEREHMPEAEVMAFWETCKPVFEDDQVASWLSAKKLDPETLTDLDIVRAMDPKLNAPPWAALGTRSWARTGHRLIFLMRDAYGAARGLRAGRVTDGDTPKRLPATGYRMSGLVLACEMGVAMLRRSFAPSRVVIAEGETDTLTWAMRKGTAPFAVLGVVSGSWTQSFATAIPTGCEVLIRTDHDLAGDRYAAEVARTIGPRCHLRRSVAA